jgi:hypothetical protein
MPADADVPVALAPLAPLARAPTRPAPDAADALAATLSGSMNLRQPP